MPSVSVVLPHYNTPSATRALNVCLRTLAENTPMDYELILTAHKRREFFAYNSAAARAAGEWIVFSCTDMFFAPGWCDWLSGDLDPDTALLLSVVESGAQHPVAEQAIAGHFGHTPETFDRSGFEAFAASTPLAKEVFGWGFPLAVNRQRFLDVGGFPLEHVHDNAADLEFMTYWMRAGLKQRRVPYYVYHLCKWTLSGEGR
jgi:hypothetical protein